MLVYIESYWGDRLISGKKCSEKELRQKMKLVLEITQSEDFTALFCRMHQFDEYPLTDDIETDFVLDLDTCLVYKPKYLSEVDEE